MKNKKNQIYVALLMAGVISIAAGLFLTISGRRQVARDTEPAKGTVVEYVEQTTTDPDTHVDETLYYPVVSYKVNGETIESQYNQGEYGQIYPIGDKIDIKYDPENPEEFLIVGDEEALTSGGGIWEICLGVVILAAGMARIVWEHRMMTRE